MKSTFLALVLLVAGSTVSLAQCDKNVNLHSSKSEQIDADGAVQNTKDEQTVVEFNKSDIKVSIKGDDGDQNMAGKIKTYNCNWKVPFKEGKTVITTTLSDNGNEKDFTITIEGKDGKIILWAESPAMPDRKIKLNIDKFEEKKMN